MKKFAWMSGVMAGVLLLGMVTFLGCESSSSPDTEGIDSYFASHPYVSDPRIPSAPRDLIVIPASATISYVGQAVSFTVKGGEKPWHWDVANGNGHIASADEDGSQGLYHVDAVSANTVVVYDSNGHSAIAAVSVATTSTLLISPTSTTITNNSSSVVFAASGGLAPYTWSVGNGLKGGLNSYTGSSVVYTRTTAGDNSVTVQDSAGNSASAVVSQP